MNRADPFPGIPSVIFGVICICLLVYGMFFLEAVLDRCLAIVLGLHFANRSEISALKRRIREVAA